MEDMGFWEKKYPFLWRMGDGPIAKVERIIETIIDDKILSRQTHSKTSYDGREVQYKERLWLESPDEADHDYKTIPDIEDTSRFVLSWYVKGKDIKMLGLEHFRVSDYYDYHDGPFDACHSCLREDPRSIGSEVFGYDLDYIIIREQKFDIRNFLICKRPNEK